MTAPATGYYANLFGNGNRASSSTSIFGLGQATDAVQLLGKRQLRIEQTSPFRFLLLIV